MRYNACVMRSLLGLSILLIFGTSQAQAIITVGGEGRLLAPPVGTYKSSGVQFTGDWGNFVGTAVGPHHFLTAVHVGGGVGDEFVLNGEKYAAESVATIPGTDLALWRVKGTFRQWAQIYTKGDEVGKEIILYGRGCQRGRSFVHDGVVKGWLWGGEDGQLSWGRNRVDGTATIPGNQGVLVFDFDRNSGDEEGTVGKGDSGGGVFLQDGTEWKLAGVNYASGGQYSRVPSGEKPFMAALFDTRDLYQNRNGRWEILDPGAPVGDGTFAFASRVSSHASEIQAIVGEGRQTTAARPWPLRTYALLGSGLLFLLMILIGIQSRPRKRLTEEDSW